jgi:hypothetical protein
MPVNFSNSVELEILQVGETAKWTIIWQTLKSARSVSNGLHYATFVLHSSWLNWGRTVGPLSEVLSFLRQTDLSLVSTIYNTVLGTICLLVIYIKKLLRIFGCYEQSSLEMSNNAGILFCPIHTTRIAGTRTLPLYRKTEDVHIQAVRFETQTKSMAIGFFMASIRWYDHQC